MSYLQTVDPCKEEKRGRSLYYTPDVTCTLKEIWEAGGEVCGELLQPVIKEYVSIFRRDNTWRYGDETTGKILAISEGTAKERISYSMMFKGNTEKTKNSRKINKTSIKVSVSFYPYLLRLFSHLGHHLYTKMKHQLSFL